MISDRILGYIKNKIVFYKGELRLAIQEPIRYSLPPIPDNESMNEIRKPRPDRRPCLGGCNKMFKSQDIDNRVCPKCTERLEKENMEPDIRLTIASDDLIT